MKSFRAFLLASVLLLGGAGCESPVLSPQERAAVMIDQQIQQIQNDISNHSSRLPNDRDRWSQSSLDIERQLYTRLDDLNRQRQILAVEMGGQKFDPRTTPPPTPKAER